MPLIVRGARQVGKTYIIESFGKEEFDHCLTINFEESPKFQTCFKDLDPVAILNQIGLISQQRVIPGKSLLFFDEVQQCPRALQSLRYFKEKLPALHVIAAGSLLEFALKDDEFSFPVGRIQFARLYPLSFEEFLLAGGYDDLVEALASYDFEKPPPLAIHEHLLSQLQDYFLTGGMPAAVLSYLTTRAFLDVKRVQQSLWSAFESDFGKYATQTQHQHLKKVFEALPRLLGDHIKYSRISPDIPNPAREMKHAIELLKLAGLLHPIYATSGGSLPLTVGLRESIFKWLCLDIGLVQCSMDVDPQHPGTMLGPLAEQFVGQQIFASSDPLLETHLFFWSREQGTAEVDYLFPHKGVVYPVEVKTGKSGKLKSLHLFMKEKKVATGIKISPEPLSQEGGILSIPLYLTSHLPRLIDSWTDQFVGM